MDSASNCFYSNQKEYSIGHSLFELYEALPCFSNIYFAEGILIIFATSINYVFCLQHCAGINCLAVLKSPGPDECNYLFTGSRDATLKRWALSEDSVTSSATFESHIDWVQVALKFN